MGTTGSSATSSRNTTGTSGSTASDNTVATRYHSAR
jgi:hypothetical protein